MRSLHAKDCLVLLATLSACGRINFDEVTLAAQQDAASTVDASIGDDGGCAACSASTYDAVGAGTPDDPYQIANADQWLDLASTSAAWASNYRVIRDIDLTPVTGDHPPIGTELVPFTGSFDGGGFLITGYRNTSGSTFSGFFGYVSSPTSVIHDVALFNPHVAGGETTGGLVGLLDEGRVERAATLGPECHVLSPAYANHKGGLIGSTNPTAIVNDVFSTCRLSGTGIGVAGLVGHHEGALTNGYYHNESFPVVATSRVAGLLGWNVNNASVTNAFTVASVQGNTANPDVGLHIGTASGTATNTYFNSAATLTNLGTGGTNTNGTPIDISDQPEYFFQAQNPPLSSWDFEAVWTPRTGNYPTLSFLADRGL